MEKRKFIANYHTHTMRCHHAVGEDREYVESAISAGIQILGFSDHVPWPYASGYVSPTRMRMDEIGEYCTSILSLKEEYKDQIEIHIGFEAEHFPSMYADFRRMIDQYPYEYLILSPHFPGTEELGVYYGRPFSNPAYLERYVEDNIIGMETGDYLYLAHPDIGLYTGDRTAYEEGLYRLCVTAKKCSMPIELNLLGFRRNSHYPSETLMKMAAEIGNDVILGADAHDPRHFSDPKMIEDCYAFAEQFGVHLIDRLELKPRG